MTQRNQMKLCIINKHKLMHIKNINQIIPEIVNISKLMTSQYKLYLDQADHYHEYLMNHNRVLTNYGINQLYEQVYGAIDELYSDEFSGLIFQLIQSHS